jgi:hypothetical protein
MSHVDLNAVREANRAQSDNGRQAELLAKAEHEPQTLVEQHDVMANGAAFLRWLLDLVKQNVPSPTP